MHRLFDFGALAVVVTPPAFATSVTSFTSVSAFQRMFPTALSGDFDQFFADNGATSLGASGPVSVGGFSINQSFSGGGDFSPLVTDGSLVYEINSGAASPHMQLRARGEAEFEVDTPIFGFGATCNSPAPKREVTLTVGGESFWLVDFLSSPPPLPGAPDEDLFGGFFGFASTTPIPSFSIDTANKRANPFALDDTVFSTVAPILAPMPLALGLTALGALEALRGGVPVTPPPAPR